MLQRVGLCQTLLHDPDVILLDEPMSGLDPVGRAMVRDIILEEQSAGRTVFFCSHVLSDVRVFVNEWQYWWVERSKRRVKSQT